MISTRNTIWLFLLLVGVSTTAQPVLHLPDVFGDHMVLQRDKPLPVWGSSQPGTELIVSLADQKVTVNADGQGRWRTQLPAMAAGGPHVLTVSNGVEAITFTDIYVGEVWICSGQSNMEWPLINSATAEQGMAEADQPMVRLFHLKKKHDTYGSPYTEREMKEFNAGHFFERAQWEVSRRQTAAPFSAVAFFFGKELYDSLRVPIGLIQAAVGGSPAQSWVSSEALAGHPQLTHLVDEDSNWMASPIIHPWVAERALQNWDGRESGGKGLPGHPFAPGYLYDSAIEPLAPFAVRGVIWYQGESNATDPDSYPAMQNTLIDSWRLLFEQGDLPFLFVQLPRIENRSRWPDFRAAQMESLQLPNTGMVVTLDQGHPTDVHPREKQVIGERLARLALVKSYKQDLAAESPTLQSYAWTPPEYTITIKIMNTYGELSPLQGTAENAFALEGYSSDGKQAYLIQPTTVTVNGNSIILTYPEDLQPVSVKYAWLPFPVNLLQNSAGLPLAPFKIALSGNN